MARHRRTHRRRMCQGTQPHLRSGAQLRYARPLERQRVEAAKLQQRGVAAQLPQQRLDRSVPEHDTCDQRTPHRTHRVVVAPAAPPGLKCSHDLLVGKGVEHQPQALKVRQAFDTVPGKGWLLRRRHRVLPARAGGWNEGPRPDGDTFYPIRERQRDAAAAILSAELERRRLWGGNPRTALSADLRAADICEAAGVKKNLGSAGALDHKGIRTAHTPRKQRHEYYPGPCTGILARGRRELMPAARFDRGVLATAAAGPIPRAIPAR